MDLNALRGCAARTHRRGACGVDRKNLSGEHHMNQFAVLDCLMEANLHNKAGTVLGQALPVTTITPTRIESAQARSQARSFALHDTAFYQPSLQVLRNRSEESCCRSIDSANPPARRVKEKHRNR